jgi:hypothetical protein
MRKAKQKPMRADYSKVDLGVGVRGKYLKEYYAPSGGAPGDSKAQKSKTAPPPRRRKRR